MNVRAKFHVTGIQYLPTVDPTYAFVTLRPVYNDGPENETWSKATPAGQITMTITNPDAISAFEQGKAYFVDFTPAG